MSFISLDEVIATASSTIADANSQFRLLARQWICTLALPQLGISEDDIKTVSLIPTSLAIPKPPDFRALIDISLFDSNNCPLDHKFRTGAKRIYRDTRATGSAIVGSDTTNVVNCLPVDVSMDTYSFHLGTNGDRVAALIVRYYSYPTDEKGLPLIRLDEALALSYFCRFMWAVRQKESLNLRETERIGWATQCDIIRARKKMASLTHENMKSIINNTWMRGMPKFQQLDQF